MQPTDQTPITPSAQAPVAAPGGKKLNKNVLIGILVGAVVLAGVIAWAVYATIANSPDNLMKAAAQNLANQKQVAAAFTIADGAGDATTSVSGDVAIAADPANDKNGQVIVNIGNDAKRTTLTALVLEKTAYLRLANAENLGKLFGVVDEPSAGAETFASPQLAAMLKNLNNQWFEFSEQDVKSLAATTGEPAGAEAAGASPEDLKRVMEIYNRHSFIKADQIFNDEAIAGANSAHFSVRLDRNEYVAFMQALKDANLATLKVTDKDIEAAKKQEERPKDARIELWIARDSKKFTQLRIVNTKKGEESTVTFTMKNDMPTFEKYEKPASTKSISELMTTLIGPSISPVELDALRNSQSSELYLTQ